MQETDETAVSVIIPVHNSEKYLGQCIDSILRQTLTDIEVICVEDYSYDASFSILQSFQKKDNRLRIIRNEKNLGAGASRNRGIGEARGKYLLFMDADDFIAPFLLEKVYEECDRFELDICLYDYVKFDDKKGVNADRFTIKNIDREEVENKIFSLKKTGDIILLPWTCALWNRLIRRRFVTENGFLFQNLHNANDVFFSYVTLGSASRVRYIASEEPFLYYRINTENQLSNSRGKSPYCIYKALKAVVDFYSENLSEYMNEGFYNCILSHIIHSLRSVDYDCRRELAVFYHDEGLENLQLRQAYHKGYFSGLKKNMLEKIIHREEDTWLKTIDIDESTMFFNSERTAELSRFLAAQKDKCALWGAGKLGKRFLYECKSENVKLDYIIDNDRKKSKEVINGCKIRTFQECKRDYGIVLVSNSKWVDEIKNILHSEKMNVYLIDLYLFYGLKVDLAECIERITGDIG